MVCHVGRGGRGRRRADRLGVPELLVVAGEVGGVRREGRGRRVLWVVPSPSSPVDPPPLRSEGRCERDFLVGRTCQEEKLWTDHLDESSRAPCLGCGPERSQAAAAGFVEEEDADSRGGKNDSVEKCEIVV